MSHRRLFSALALGALLFLGEGRVRADFFVQTNLVSDGSVPANTTDASLINPWGISFGGKGPFWVSNQGTNTTTLYDFTGAKKGQFNIPHTAGPPTGPTGQVFNSTPDFALSVGGKALFIFANLDGTISAWNGAIGSTAEIHVPASAGTSYTGLGIGNNGTGNFLYAADNGNGKIDAFNGSFAKTALSGTFTDPTLPSGFHPFNVQNIGGTLYVTFEHGTLGGGVVDAFDLNGNFLHRIGSNGAGGALESPWGLAIAPALFGSLGGKLLVGNEDDGRISIFDPTKSGPSLGFLLGPDGQPISNLGLWGLTFGNGGANGDPNILYFAAGLAGETHGLFGALAVPEPSSYALLGLGGIAFALVRMRAARRTRVSV